MFRFIVYAAIAAAITAVGFWLASFSWSVVLETDRGVDYEVPFWAAAVMAAAIGLLIAVVWAIVRGVWNLPHAIQQARRRSRTRKGNEALTAGLLALESGDTATAIRHADKARGTAEDERLSLLLEAKAAETAEDWAGAERVYEQLSRKPGGGPAALKGLTAAALKRGDTDGAKTKAIEALSLSNISADWPFNTVFEINTMSGDWTGALDTLAIGERQNLVSNDQARRRRAVLKSAIAAESTDASTSERLFSEVVKQAPSLTPAVVLGARQLIGAGKSKLATQWLEAGWKARPHPAITALLRTLYANGESLSKLRYLASQRPDDRESRILQTEIAIESEEWLEASQLLAELLEEGATARLFSLMEQVARGQQDLEAATRWSRLAANAPREPFSTDTDTRGRAFRYSNNDWAALIYAFGDAGQLIHPRQNDTTIALPAPVGPTAGQKAIANTPAPADDKRPSSPPTDYVGD